jgi:hydroxysqualene dehydroxylase
MRARVAVVGGGLAGISAALTCAEAGMEVTLLERQARLGGATWSFERNGRSFDNGQHVFLRCCSAYRGFLERLGVTDLTKLQPRLRVPLLWSGARKASLWRSNLPSPAHLAGCLLSYSPLSVTERLAASRAALALGQLELDDPALDQISFGQWWQRRGGSQRTLDVLWDILLRPTCNVSATDVSLAMAAKVFKTGLLETAGGADIGWSRVPLGRLHGEHGARAAKRAGVTVRTRAAVRSVENRIDGAFDLALDDGHLEADAVIMALPHEVLGDVLPASMPDLGLERLGTSPIVNVAVVFDRKVVDWDLAASLEPPLQWVFDRSEATGLETGQCLGVSLSAAEEWLGWRPEELSKHIIAALQTAIPAARQAKVLDVVVTKERHATFVAAPGRASLRLRTRTEIEGLFIAGAWTDTGWPATMEGAVRSGLSAARAALVHCNHVHALPKEVVA